MNTLGDTLLEVGLSNAVAATLLALLAAGAGCFYRRPAVLHALWLLVLVKLITPPVFRIDVVWTTPALAAADGQEERLPSIVEPTPDRIGLQPQGTQGAQPIPAAETALAERQPAESEALPASHLAPDSGLRAEPQAARLVEDPRSATTVSLAEEDWLYPPAILATWLLGAAAWLALSAVRVRRFHLALRQAELAPSEQQERVRELAGRLGLRGRLPGLWMVPAPISPMLYALPGVTRLLVPIALWDRLSAEQRDALLLHELAHLKRRDHWVRWLEMPVLALFFWHPVAWWARGRLRELEEQLADAWVLWATRGSPGAAATYADTLLEAVFFLSKVHAPLPQPASGIGHVSSLRRRLKMILGSDRARRLGLVGLLLVLSLWTLGLLFSPGLAQSRPADAEEQEPLDRGSRVLDERVFDVGSRVLGERVTQARPKPQDAPAETAPREVYRAKAAPADQQDLKDEIELLTIQLEAKKAELQEAEAFIEQANRRAADVARAKGAVSSGEADQAQTDVRVLAARRRAKEAQVREVELRLTQAGRRLGIAQPRPTRSDVWVGSREPSTGDSRFDSLEKKLDALTREVAALRQELRLQRPRSPFPEKVPVYEKVPPGAYEKTFPPIKPPVPEKAPLDEKLPPPLDAPAPEKPPLAR